MRIARITLVLVVALMLLAALPVSADAPTIENWTYDEYGPWDWAPCDFTVMEHEVLRARTTTYYDDAGNPVKMVMFFNGHSTFTNPDNPGVELVTKTISATFRWDYANSDWDVTGLTIHVNIPKYGTVLVRSGLWSTYPFGHDAGKDSFDSEADKQAFCSYLAGN